MPTFSSAVYAELLDLGLERRCTVRSEYLKVNINLIVQLDRTVREKVSVNQRLRS